MEWTDGGLQLSNFPKTASQQGSAMGSTSHVEGRIDGSSALNGAAHAGILEWSLAPSPTPSVLRRNLGAVPSMAAPSIQQRIYNPAT